MTNKTTVSAGMTDPTQRLDIQQTFENTDDENLFDHSVIRGINLSVRILDESDLKLSFRKFHVNKWVLT